MLRILRRIRRTTIKVAIMSAAWGGAIVGTAVLVHATEAGLSHWVSGTLMGALWSGALTGTFVVALWDAT
jgi:hypothetical protein